MSGYCIPGTQSWVFWPQLGAFSTADFAPVPSNSLQTKEKWETEFRSREKHSNHVATSGIFPVTSPSGKPSLKCSKSSLTSIHSRASFLNRLSWWDNKPSIALLLHPGFVQPGEWGQLITAGSLSCEQGDVSLALPSKLPQNLWIAIVFVISCFLSF